MFIKTVTKKNSLNGKEYPEFRITQSYRTNAGPRHKTLITLREIPVPKQQWKELCDTIEGMLSGQEIIVFDQTIQSFAEHVVRLIRRNGISSISANITGQEAQIYETIAVNSLRTSEVRTLGAEHIGHTVYKELGFEAIFSDLGFTHDQCQDAAMSIIGRLVHPSSELENSRWLEHNSALPELLGVGIGNISLSALYRISDKLYEHREAIEDYLSQRERSIFNLKESIILYDLTNTYFEGIALRNSKAKFGRSKEKRSDCRLLTLGLVIDELGFPKRSQVMKGSVSEPGTLSSMIKSLNLGSESGRKPTIIIDAGISCQSNLDYLRDENYDYVCVARNKPVPLTEVSPSKFVTVKQDKFQHVEAQIFRHQDETILYCHSKKMEEKENAMREKFCGKFELELNKIIASLTKRNNDKSYQAILTRIARLKERYATVSRFYKIELTQNNGIVTAIEFGYQKQDEMVYHFSGSYWLRTSLPDLDEQEIWSLYMTLNHVENAFRSLKSELNFRPIFHQMEKRSDAHLFIAVLAYHILNAIRYKLLAAGIHLSWKTVRNIMSSHCMVTSTMQTKDNHTLTIRDCSSLEELHINVYNALHISHKPLKRRRTKMPNP